MACPLPNPPVRVDTGKERAAFSTLIECYHFDRALDLAWETDTGSN